MSKVKLIVGSLSIPNDGAVIRTGVSVPEDQRIVGIIRTDFDPASDGSVRASDDLDPVISYERINDLVGKLLTMIDATFTDKEQRQAMKDLYKQIAWDWYQNQQQPLQRPWENDREIANSDD